MKLNDTKVGIKPHITAELYAELDAFIKGPRNQLAHRFLIERIVDVDQRGMPALAAATLELMNAGRTAKRLTTQLYERSRELMATWPESEDPPPEVVKALEVIARATLLKEFPRDLVEQA